MTETLTRSAPDKEEWDRAYQAPQQYEDKRVAGEVPSLDTLNEMLNAGSETNEAPASSEAEQLELFNIPTSTPEAYPTLSPAAELVRSGAERVATFLERRAVDSAHGEALKEYRERDAAAYTDHLANLAEATDQNGEALEGQAYGQRLLNRENRREDRAEMFARGRTRLRNIGDTALGAGIIAIQGTQEGARNLHRNIEERWDQRQTERENNRALKDLAKETAKKEKETAKQRREQERADARQLEEMRKELDREARERRAKERRDAALARKRARRQKWARRKERIIGAYETAQGYRRKQQQRVGAFALRARAAGQAARTTWREFDPDQK